MRFIGYGAGAVGGVVGALLSAAGYEVILIARGPHLDALRRDGLRLRTPTGERIHRVTAVGHPAEIDRRPDDVVLLGVKSMDTADALSALAAHVHPDTPVMCLQNGVANEAAALRMFAHVHGVCVMLPAAHLSPGEVIAYASPVPGILDIGRFPGGVDAAAEAVAAAFRSAGFVSEARPDIMRWKYAKLLTNLGNALEAVCGPVPAGSETARRLRAEGEDALRAAGVDFASAAEDRERRGDILRVRAVGGRARPGGSSWQSLSRGTGTVEADFLNGEIVLLGRLNGIATPVNERVRRLANRFAREGTPPGAVDPDRLLAEI
jgi:2-dehydropantoate 2-reductase